MMKVHFFATPADISPALAEFESKLDVKFVEMGVTTTPNRAIYLESDEIPEPGLATHETASRSKAYLVSRRDTKNNIRSDAAPDGQKRWNLVSADNEEAVILSLGGLWTTGTLLPGLMDSMHDNPVVKELLKSFAAALKKSGFKKVKQWWVGPEAMEMLKAGKRLATTAEQSPPAYDLKLPEK
ncbi:hypothetical protein LY632_05490 [Erythrobacter sp. SDW2]|uniref:hypothetical protein n=1 Tax=Erythrobacter sp. SDW2 TaxID=2907154 RepID=UPI001F22E796|nr:hypothetical protein [Erythrobacter sp. SDW2]UIP07854.1 hypothetical protein LY632_05490 [Erythrobacter sp. SDW2]